MRKAYYYGTPVPPKDWLVYASLLWDKVWVGPELQWLSETFEKDMLLDNDSRFAYQLFTQSDILDVSLPVYEIKLLSEEEKYRFNHFYEKLSKFNQAVIDGTYPGVLPPPGEKFPPPTYEQMLQLASLFTQSLTPSWASKAFHELDYFFAHKSDFQEYHSLNANILQASIEAILPTNPNDVSTAQLIDFREATKLQRLKFRKEAEKLVNDLFACSTEDDLQRTTRLCEEYILEQINILEINYRSYKIEALKKVLGVTFAAPALLAALSSALHIPFYMPAAIISTISLASAEILLTVEKGKSEIMKSPWAYLRSLKKL